MPKHKNIPFSLTHRNKIYGVYSMSNKKLIINATPLTTTTTTTPASTATSSSSSTDRSIVDCICFNIVCPTNNYKNEPWKQKSYELQWQNGNRLWFLRCKYFCLHFFYSYFRLFSFFISYTFMLGPFYVYILPYFLLR